MRSSSPFKVSAVEKGERAAPGAPAVPHQHAAAGSGEQLGFSAAVTMRIAQQLYEASRSAPRGGGVITYMRTDFGRVADSAIAQARDYIAKEFGKAYLPPKPVVHKGGKSSTRVQDAHEAIRPTDVPRRRTI